MGGGRGGEEREGGRGRDREIIKQHVLINAHLYVLKGAQSLFSA